MASQRRYWGIDGAHVTGPCMPACSAQGFVLRCRRRFLQGDPRQISAGFRHEIVELTWHRQNQLHLAEFVARGGFAQQTADIPSNARRLAVGTCARDPPTALPNATEARKFGDFASTNPPTRGWPLVGDTGVEPVTSCVSCKRANQLRQSPGGRLTLAPCPHHSAIAAGPLGTRPGRRGGDRIRTGVHGFAGRCLTTRPLRQGPRRVVAPSRLER